MNHPKDVVVVQQLLNGHMQRDPCRKPMRVDGKWSQELERAIGTFQKLAGGHVATEGRIEPRTRLFEQILQSPALFGFERRMEQHMRPAPVIQEPTIEVFIFDGRLLSSGSQFGHSAIDIDGKTYSQAHTKYAILDRNEYLKSNLTRVKRDVVGLVLQVSEAEKLRMKTELDRRLTAQKPYSIIDNNCSTNVAEVLEMIGILAHDPRAPFFSSNMVSPKELLIIVSRSSRVVKRNNYRKNN